MHAFKNCELLHNVSEAVCPRDSTSWGMAAKAIKLVVVGDSGGDKNKKTHLLITYTTNSYPLDYVPTVFDNYSVNILVDGQPINLGLWDTAHQEDYDRLRPLSYPSTDVFMIVFSVVSPSSFESVTSKWVPELRLHAPSCPIVLVGCDVELRDDPITVSALQAKGKAPITFRQGEQLAMQIKARGYAEVDIPGLRNVKQAFDAAVRVVLKPRAQFQSIKVESHSVHAAAAVVAAAAEAEKIKREADVLPLFMRKASLFGSKWEQRYFRLQGDELCHSSKLSNLTTGDLHGTKRMNLQGATFTSTQSQTRSEKSGSETLHVFSIKGSDGVVSELASSSLADVQKAVQAFTQLLLLEKREVRGERKLKINRGPRRWVTPCWIVSKIGSDLGVTN